MHAPPAAAGEPIATRWTPAIKAEVKRSRVNTTSQLAAAINACPEDQRPVVLVSSSAVGYYGNSEVSAVPSRASLAARHAGCWLRPPQEANAFGRTTGNGRLLQRRLEGGRVCLACAAPHAPRPALFDPPPHAPLPARLPLAAVANLQRELRPWPRLPGRGACDPAVLRCGCAVLQGLGCQPAAQPAQPPAGQPLPPAGPCCRSLTPTLAHATVRSAASGRRRRARRRCARWCCAPALCWPRRGARWAAWSPSSPSLLAAPWALGGSGAAGSTGALRCLSCLRACGLQRDSVTVCVCV